MPLSALFKLSDMRLKEHNQAPESTHVSITSSVGRKAINAAKASCTAMNSVYEIFVSTETDYLPRNLNITLTSMCFYKSHPLGNLQFQY